MIVLILLFYSIFLLLLKSNIDKNVYNIKHISYIRHIFYILNNKRSIKCHKVNVYKCISFQSEIINMYRFFSNIIDYSYIHSFSLLFKSFVLQDEIFMKKFEVIHKKDYLKSFGFINTIITQNGIIYSDCWEITTKGGCKCSYIPNKRIESIKNATYDKVVSITHHWGNAVFHSVVECLAKLGYYIPELLDDISIKIHAYRSASIQYLNFLGFNNSRIIYGNVFAKKLIVLEKGSCGSTPPLLHLQYLRNYLRKKIKSNPIYKLVLIKRYGIRDIINFNDLYNILIKKYGKKNIAIFYSNTSFTNTLNYFKYAKLIIAPHGAGLSNIIISYNCTVIEFLQKNLCYSGLSNKLGLNYYGIFENVTNNKFNINVTFFRMFIKKISI